MVSVFATAPTGGASKLFTDSRALESLGLSSTTRLDSSDAGVWRFDNAANNVIDFARSNVRNDDLFAIEALTYIETRAAEQLFAPLTAQQAFAVRRVGEWDDYIKHYSYEQFGRAAQICCAADFPRVSIDGAEMKTPTITIGSGFDLCYADIKKGEQAGVDVGVRLMNAARRAIEQQLNRYAWFGDSKAGILGVANSPMIGVVNAPFRMDDLTVDPFILLGVLNAAATQARIASGTAMPAVNAVAIAPSLLRGLKTRYMGVQRTDTVWQSFLSMSGITKVTEAPELECLHNGQRTMFLYNSAEENIHWNVPMALEVLPPVNNGYGYSVNMIARVNSLWLDYPRHAVKIVG
jgi:hypothetical protein